MRHSHYHIIRLSSTIKPFVFSVGVIVLSLLVVGICSARQSSTAVLCESPSASDLPAAAVSDSSAAADYSNDAEHLGGELISDTEVGDIPVIPAYVRLDRLTIDREIVKPLKYASVSSLFGCRVNPVTGKYSFHSGLDLAAPGGTSIYAMLDGKVAKAAFDKGYGNHVIIDHGDGLQTLYAHCSKLKVNAGQSVSAGDTIALVGSTGNSTGNHLHVEFRKDGQRFDPEWLLGGIYQ